VASHTIILQNQEYYLKAFMIRRSLCKSSTWNNKPHSFHSSWQVCPLFSMYNFY